MRKLLMAIKHLNYTNRFLIIGSDGWADRQDVVADYEMQAVGSISIRIHSPYITSFDDYYFGLNPFDNFRNPWFREFWEDKFHCKMPANRPLPMTSTMPSTASDDNETDFTTMTTFATTQIPYCTGKQIKTGAKLALPDYDASVLVCDSIMMSKNIFVSLQTVTRWD